MKKMIAVLLLLCLLLAGCGSGRTVKVDVSSDTLYVKAVENLPKDFILGMDVSSVLAEEASGVKYYNFADEEQDLFQILAETA